MPKETFYNLPEAKRQHILDVAITEFAAKPYKTASISRIVRKTGIAKGSFYQYFEDKKDLYLYLVHLAGEQKAAFFDNFPPPNPNMGTFEYLRWLFTIRVQFEVSNPRLNQIAYRAIFGDAPFPEAVRHQAEGQASDFTRQLLARGQAAGDLDPNVDTELAAFIFNSVFLRLGEYLLQRLDIEAAELMQEQPVLFETPEADAIFDGIMRILQQGMGRKNGP